MGRPDETYLDGKGHGPISITLVQVRTQRRLRIPTRQKQTIEWLDANNETDAVAELARRGQIILHPLSGPVKSILTRRATLLGMNLSDQDVIREMLAIEERNQRLSIDQEGRFKIYDRMEDHLRVPIEVGTKIYVVVLPITVELWSQQYREQCHEELWDAFGGLEDGTG